MTERYPDNAMLLALSEDAATGVEYIPTGKSPYYLEFRKLLYRLLRASERANDLRVYQDGDLSVGVRGGRVLLGGTPVDFAGTEGVSVAAGETTSLWLDAAGTVQSNTSGMPSDRTSFVPLAEVVADSAAITAVTDRRGEAFLTLPSTGALGLTATADQINQALGDIDSNVHSLALNFLCGGATSTADSLHRHTRVYQEVAGDAKFTLVNDSADPAANAVLRFSLPSLLPRDTLLRVNRDNGFLQQAYDDTSYNLLGCVHAQLRHEGQLTGSVSGKLAGIVPVNGTVSDVVLSVGSNLESSDTADGVSATARVNGTALTSTDPGLVAGDGSGFVSTAQGDGTAAVVKADGTEQVQRGDVLSVDLTRAVSGTVSSEAQNVVVMITIRVDQPE